MSCVDPAQDITTDEVLSALADMRSNKALGGSWISAELLK